MKGPVQIDAHGEAITPMMAVNVLRRAKLIAKVAVNKVQLVEIARLYLPVQKDPETQDHFLGFKLIVNADMPKDEIHFQDSQGKIVGKIVNLGRSRAIPIEEVSKVRSGVQQDAGTERR